MVGRTRQVHYEPEVGQGSGMVGTENTQDPPPLAPFLASVMLGAEQFQQLLGGIHRGDDFSRATKNFFLFGGSQFDGLGGALRALAWVEGCEEAFQHMPLSSVQRRRLATQTLDGPALHWWRAIRGGLDLGVFDWDGFLLRFQNKFVPLSERNHLEKSFISLRQGGLFVIQLINRFNELSQFAPFMVDTEEKRVKRLLHCLNPQLAIQCQNNKEVLTKGRIRSSREI